MEKHRKLHHKFEVVESSHGVWRFIVACGSEEHTNIKGKKISHALEEVVVIIEAYLRQTALEGDFFINGTVTSGIYVSVWPDEENKEVEAQHEPRLIYSGNIDPRKASRLIVEEFLNGLGSILGYTLKQKKVYISLNDERWIIQRKKL